MTFFITTTSHHQENVPVILIFGIATTVSSVHTLLPHSVSSHLSIHKFQSLPSSAHLTKLLDKVCIVSVDYKNYFLQLNLLLLLSSSSIIIIIIIIIIINHYYYHHHQSLLLLLLLLSFGWMTEKITKIMNRWILLSSSSIIIIIIIIIIWLND